MNAATARVLVVVEIPLWRELLIEYLAERDDYVVLGANGIDEALAQLERESVDLILLDMTIAGSTAAVPEFLTRAARSPLVGLGFMSSDRRILSAVEAGMAGYVSVDGGLSEFFRVLAAVSSGGVAVSPRVAAALVDRVRALGGRRLGDEADEGARLTRREHEILRLIENGMSNKEIAARLSIEVTTVKNHVHRILTKLGVNRRSQAAAVVRSRSSASATQQAGRDESPTTDDQTS